MKLLLLNTACYLSMLNKMTGTGCWLKHECVTGGWVYMPSVFG